MKKLCIISFLFILTFFSSSAFAGYIIEDLKLEGNPLTNGNFPLGTTSLTVGPKAYIGFQFNIQTDNAAPNGIFQPVLVSNVPLPIVAANDYTTAGLRRVGHPSRANDPSNCQGMTPGQTLGNYMSNPSLVGGTHVYDWSFYSTGGSCIAKATQTYQNNGVPAGTYTFYYAIKENGIYTANISPIVTITFLGSFAANINYNTETKAGIIIFGSSLDNIYYNHNTNDIFTVQTAAISGTAQMRISTPTNVGSWVAYSPNVTTIAMGDMTEGTKTVSVEFKDSFGNISPKYSDTVIWDKTPPVISTFSINNGSGFTNNTNISLSISANDNLSTVKDMCISENTSVCTNWISYNGTSTYNLINTDGLKTIYLKLRDKAGNVSTSSTSSITLDTTSPVITNMKVDSGNLYTANTGVTISFSGTDTNSIDSLCLSDTNSCTNWVSYTGNIGYTIPNINGLRTVHLKIRDIVGNVSLDSTGSITLDNIKPTSSLLGELTPGSGLHKMTNSIDSVINISCNDTNPGCLVHYTLDRSVPTINSPTGSISLTGGINESKYINYFAEDISGNLENTVHSATFLYSDSYITSNTISTTTGSTLSLSGTCNDSTHLNINSVEYSLNGSSYTGVTNNCTNKLWSDNFALNLNQVNIIDLRLKNTPSTSKHLSFIQDNIKPVITNMKVDSGNLYTANTGVTISFSGTDSNNIDSLCLSDTNSCTNWVSYTENIGYTIPNINGLKTVHLKIRDIAGNVSLDSTGSITLDNIKPVIDSSNIINSGIYNQSKQIGIATNVGQIYYTLDGSKPTSLSTLYNSGFTIGSNGGILTLKTIAIGLSNLKSDIISRSYNFQCSTIANGSNVGYPTCTLTCDSGYQKIGNTCEIIPPVVSGGGGSGRFYRSHRFDLVKKSNSGSLLNGTNKTNVNNTINKIDTSGVDIMNSGSLLAMEKYLSGHLVNEKLRNILDKANLISTIDNKTVNLYSGYDVQLKKKQLTIMYNYVKLILGIQDYLNTRDKNIIINLQIYYKEYLQYKTLIENKNKYVNKIGVFYQSKDINLNITFKKILNVIMKKQGPIDVPNKLIKQVSYNRIFNNYNYFVLNISKYNINKTNSNKSTAIIYRDRLSKFINN